MSVQYQEVSTTDGFEEYGKKKQHSTIYFFRQLFVASGAIVLYFIVGMYIGAPTVVIPQLRREANSSNAVGADMASWISSMSSYGSLPWECILPISLFALGRKKTSIFIHVMSIVFSITFYMSSTPIQLLIFEFLQGLLYGGVLTTSIVILVEYSAPEHRGFFLTLKSASVYWGVWVANTIGTFFHWRYIAVASLACSVFTLTVFLWPESPSWLATKGRFEECRIAHRWLKGTGEKAERELEELINSQRETVPIKVRDFPRHLMKTIRSKDFYKPVFVSCLAMVLYLFSGKIVCSVYAIEIIKKITDNESAAYSGMLILDGVTIFSMYTGCALSKIVKRRTLLLGTSFFTILFLFAISISLYLVKMGIVNENKYVSISLLAGFSMSVSAGPVILCVAIYGELTPLRYKSISIVITSLVFSSLQSVLLKIAPYIFKSFQMHGAFLFYAISMSFVALLLYKYLPETKDKTLREIEEYFIGLLDDECNEKVKR